MPDEAFNELMGRMSDAVNSAKTASDHVKTASVDELDAPGDILANTIHRMNDEIRRESFPEEMEKNAIVLDDDDDANADIDADADAEAAAAKAVADKDGKDGKDDDPASTADSTKKAEVSGRTLEDDLNNPFVSLGFNAELKLHEPAIKQAAAKICQASVLSR